MHLGCWISPCYSPFSLGMRTVYLSNFPVFLGHSQPQITMWNYLCCVWLYIHTVVTIYKHNRMKNVVLIWTTANAIENIKCEYWLWTISRNLFLPMPSHCAVPVDGLSRPERWSSCQEIQGTSSAETGWSWNRTCWRSTWHRMIRTGTFAETDAWWVQPCKMINTCIVTYLNCRDCIPTQANSHAAHIKATMYKSVYCFCTLKLGWGRNHQRI
jgi:hypothetical protein